MYADVAKSAEATENRSFYCRLVQGDFVPYYSRLSHRTGSLYIVKILAPTSLRCGYFCSARAILKLAEPYTVFGNDTRRKFSQFALSTASRTSAGTTEPTLYISATVSISNGLSSRPSPPSKSDPTPT